MSEPLDLDVLVQRAQTAHGPVFRSDEVLALVAELRAMRLVSGALREGLEWLMNAHGWRATYYENPPYPVAIDTSWGSTRSRIRSDDEILAALAATRAEAEGEAHGGG